MLFVEMGIGRLRWGAYTCIWRYHNKGMRIVLFSVRLDSSIGRACRWGSYFYEIQACISVSGGEGA